MKILFPKLLLFLWGFWAWGCRPARVGSDQAIASLRLIGFTEIPVGTLYEGTTLGGLSGIDWDGRNTYYLISDDKGSAEARVYKARISFDLQGFREFRLEGLVRLQLHHPDPHLDPEAIRYEPATGHLLWTNEGSKTHLAPATLTRSDTLGRYISQIPLPAQFGYMPGEETGLRQNGSLESLSLGTHPDHLWIMNEEPLYEDGEPASLSPDQLAPLRLTLLHQTTGALLAQYPYLLDPISGPITGQVAPINSVSEVLATSDHILLILERMYTGGQCNHIRVYAVDLRGAADISHMPSLRETAYQPLPKRLVLDFNNLTGFCADNIEGMTVGPRLANGNRSLVFVADDNFNPKGQKTQVVVFEVLE